VWVKLSLVDKGRFLYITPVRIGLYGPLLLEQSYNESYTNSCSV
jgi:hypothetical protein